MTATTAPLTASDIAAAYDNDEWLGYGYLGQRRLALDVSDPESEPLEVMQARVAVADEMVLFHANRLGWSAADFFTWMNSKLGRWSAELLIVDGVHAMDASTDGQLRGLMTLKGLR